MTEFKLMFGIPDVNGHPMAPGTVVSVCFHENMHPLTCTVRKVHYDFSHIQYDLDLWEYKPGGADANHARIYNIDSRHVNAIV